jgi:CubicO group peptidase (beta-lactamase class C family)
MARPPARSGFRARNAVALGLGLALSAPGLGAQHTPTAPAPLDPATVAGIDGVFGGMDNTRSPGCAVGVVRGGELAFGRGYGMANLEHGLALDTRSVLRMGSVGKQFTAATIVLLALDGLVDLDADIRSYLPELPDFGSPVTVRHLLTHTSGYRDYLVLMRLAGNRDDDFYDDEDLYRVLSAQEELNFPPGAEFLYSNSGYFLMSQLVLRVTGRSLGDVADERIFEPLGMPDTHYHDNWQRVVPRRATGYAPADWYRPEGDGEMEDPFAGSEWVVSQTTLPMVGDGGVFSSVEEMTPWVDNLMHADVVGGPKWRDALLTRAVLTSGDTLDYALGLRLADHRGLTTVGHGGAFVGYRAAVLTYPDEDTGISVLCNRADVEPMGLAMAVGEAILEDRMSPLPPTETEGESPGLELNDVRQEPPQVMLSADDLARFAGDFRSPELLTVYRIRAVDGELLLEISGREAGRLDVIGPERLALDEIEFRFESEAGVFTGFRLDAGRVKNLRFERR